MMKKMFVIALAIFLTFPAYAKEPGFNLYRWNEDYAYLAKKSDRDWYNRFKYAPLREDVYVSFGGSLRERSNMYDNDRFGLLGVSDGHLFLHRVLLHADLHVTDRFRFFAELGSHLVERNGLRPGPFDRDDADVTQAFFDLRYAGSQWRVGRQEMDLGSTRLVSVRNGPNVRRAFNGIRFDTKISDVDLRLFGMNEVKVKKGAFNNGINDDEILWGIYATKDINFTKASVYYLGLYRKGAVYTQNTANETRHSIGTHLFGKRNGWDWNYELIYQFGDFGDADISAWTAASVTGYTFNQITWSPRVAFNANIASGDKNPDNGKLNTFNPLYPNLTYFEEAAVLAPQNFYNIKPEISFYPFNQLSMTFNWNFFWRVEKNDAVYVGGLIPLLGTASVDGHFVAHAPSISIDYQLNHYVALDLSYSHFFAGKVINNAGGNDINFLKLELNITF
ncbi:alginate export family protein [uncultured Nitrosomonas sp.]|uniref:alginate export family protein n=1 Tax=uncultured Nitrosomonas sp. TaxID=156424 RepID=UPI0025F737E0|nr:alginate export family protein [uncultured Nitrosomonas sp.]